VNQTMALADDDVRAALRGLDADLQACLALSRATLQALATFSPLLGASADAALEEEAERAARAACKRVTDVVEEVRERLQRAPAEARVALALQRALVDAADALPHEAEPRREGSAT
jgi:DNA repair photolyase